MTVKTYVQNFRNRLCQLQNSWPKLKPTLKDCTKFHFNMILDELNQFVLLEMKFIEILDYCIQQLTFKYFIQQALKTHSICERLQNSWVLVSNIKIDCWIESFPKVTKVVVWKYFFTVLWIILLGDMEVSEDCHIVPTQSTYSWVQGKHQAL